MRQALESPRNFAATSMLVADIADFVAFHLQQCTIYVSQQQPVLTIVSNRNLSKEDAKIYWL